MRERFGNNLALRHPLQTVIADRSSGIQAFFGVAGLEQPPLRCVMSPDAGVAIGLQLESDRQRVRQAAFSEMPSMFCT